MTPEESFAAQMAEWRRTIRPEVVRVHVDMRDRTWAMLTPQERELAGSATPAEVEMAATVLQAEADQAVEAYVEAFRRQIDHLGGDES